MVSSCIATSCPRPRGLSMTPSTHLPANQYTTSEFQRSFRVDAPNLTIVSNGSLEMQVNCSFYDGLLSRFIL